MRFGNNFAVKWLLAEHGGGDAAWHLWCRGGAACAISQFDLNCLQVGFQAAAGDEASRTTESCERDIVGEFSLRGAGLGQCWSIRRLFQSALGARRLEYGIGEFEAEVSNVCIGSSSRWQSMLIIVFSRLHEDRLLT